MKHLPALSTSALVALSGALAQAAQTTRPPNHDEVVNLDRLVVTDTLMNAQSYRVGASKGGGFRAQPVIDTPFSVSGFSSDFIQDIQARTVLDVTRNDPSTAPAGDPLWFDRVFIRGFYLSVNAVFRDGLGINDQGSIALDNKESVEIAKGLIASTRQGITSPGGSLTYVLKRPLAGPLTRVTAFGDGFGGYGASADLSRRFGPDNRFGARVNLTAEEIRSFVDAVEGDRTFASAAFDWRASERLYLEVEAEYQDKTISSARGPSVGSFANAAAAQALLPRFSPETRITQPWAVEPNEQFYYSARASYALSGSWRFRLAAQRSELVRDQLGLSAAGIQADGSYNIQYFFSPDQERNNSAVLAVVEGDLQTGRVLHELAFGYDYVRRDMTFGPGFSGTIGTGNLFADSVLPQPILSVGASYLQFRSNQHSVFLSDTAKVLDRVELFGVARFTRFQNIRGTAPGTLVETYDESIVTPTVGLVFKLRPSLSLYASYAEGIEQGGTAPSNAINAGQVFDPLKSDQLELGAKWELAEGALLTVAAFEIDKGLEFLDAGSGLFVQDGRQVHRGFEASLAGRVGDRLRVIAGVAWLDAEVRRTANLALIGKRPQGVPEWQANLYADYDLTPFVDGLSFNAGLYYTGDKAVDQLNTFMVDAFTRLDVGVRYRQRLSDRASVIWRLTMENATDKRYLADTSFGSLVFGSPRSVRFSATFDF